ncbi:sodium:proton antiporter activity protein [Homalodisca vitripennis]|nr:sodium:proton antiporter activity protein [Homalodisca vitripennis]
MSQFDHVVLYHMFEAYNEIGPSNLQYRDFMAGFASFFVVAIGGTLIGVIWGFLTGLVTRFTNQVRVIEPIFIFVMAYLAYLNAEIFHMSGILAQSAREQDIIEAVICCSPKVPCNKDVSQAGNRELPEDESTQIPRTPKDRDLAEKMKVLRYHELPRIETWQRSGSVRARELPEDESTQIPRSPKDRDLAELPEDESTQIPRTPKDRDLAEVRICQSPGATRSLETPKAVRAPEVVLPVTEIFQRLVASRVHKATFRKIQYAWSCQRTGAIIGRKLIEEHAAPGLAGEGGISQLSNPDIGRETSKAEKYQWLLKIPRDQRSRETDTTKGSDLPEAGMCQKTVGSNNLNPFKIYREITFCGITMKNYVEANISHKSHTTVKYAMKMLSSSSETIIFMFLGVATVSDQHDWNTWFVVLTITFCSFYRAIGVMLLTAVVNRFRLYKLNKVDKFVMSYGGLRGAVAFALVLLINPRYVKLQPMFVTTTIAVVYFTVFFQGITIKPLVKILNVKRAEKRKPTMNERIHERIMDHTMAGIEDILGHHGNHHLRDRFKRFDNQFIRPYLLRNHQGAEPKILETYSKLAMKDAMDYMRRNASTIGNISGTESMSAIFRNYTAGNLNGSFSQLDTSTWNIDLQELEYNPSKKDLTDAKIHHLLAEELCQPCRRHRRLSYSRHAVDDRDLTTQVYPHRMHVNMRRMVGDQKKHHHRRSKRLNKGMKQNHVSFPGIQQNGTVKQLANDYISEVLHEVDGSESSKLAPTKDDWENGITFTAHPSGWSRAHLRSNWSGCETSLPGDWPYTQRGYKQISTKDLYKVDHGHIHVHIDLDVKRPYRETGLTLREATSKFLTKLYKVGHGLIYVKIDLGVKRSYRGTGLTLRETTSKFLTNYLYKVDHGHIHVVVDLGVKRPYRGTGLTLIEATSKFLTNYLYKVDHGHIHVRVDLGVKRPYRGTGLTLREATSKFLTNYLYKVDHGHIHVRVDLGVKRPYRETGLMLIEATSKFLTNYIRLITGTYTCELIWV